MTSAYFDCRSGISGDMTLGALIDAGADPGILTRCVEALGLAGEVEVETRHEERGHGGGTRVLLRAQEGRTRNLPELISTVTSAALPERVAARTLDALDRLGSVESALHGQPKEQLHLHELGGADTLIDLTGSFWLLEQLGVARVYASALPAPRPPHTAPATARVLAGSGAVLEPDEREMELVTPTGATLLAVLAKFSRPALRLDRVGWGVGSREVPGNLLSVWIGAEAAPTDAVAVIEANLDDMAPNLLAALTEDLMLEGALDVSVSAAMMKKGRVGHLLAVIARLEDEARMGELILARSTTLGVRITAARRRLAGRRMIEVETQFGRVGVKVKELDGRPVDVAPEYEDARRCGGDVNLVMRVAAEIARRELGLL
ncbi:MAG: LarC family nickel insertion protein [Candidatus Dormibacteraceae bacterium]